MSATLAPATVQAPPVISPERNLAVDAYRGLVMLLMMAEVLELGRVARAFPDSGFWHVLGYHQTHVEWAGCSLHDTIQPGFSFLVGVVLPYSIASRVERGTSFPRMFVHALWRSLQTPAREQRARRCNRPARQACHRRPRG